MYPGLPNILRFASLPAMSTTHPKRLYLDANGSCPPVAEAIATIREVALLYGNPSSFHEQGRSLRAIIDDARDAVAKSLNARARDLIFTSGASEANRLFVDALLLKAKKEHKKLKVLMSPFEHPSLLKPILLAHDEDQLDVEVMAINHDGRLEETDLAAFDVIICCQAHNETGLIPNLASIIKNISLHTLLMSDCSQSLSRMQAPFSRIDALSCSAQKMGGFPGIGALVLRGNAKSLPAPWAGGGQERGFRPGTESTPLIAAFGAAALLIEQSRTKHEQLLAVREYFEAGLKKIVCRIIGADLERLPNTSAVLFYGQDPDALRIACDMAGLSVGFGAACSGLAPEGSFSLKRLGLSLEEEKCTVRFSLCPDTSFDDIDELLQRLSTKVLRKIDK